MLKKTIALTAALLLMVLLAFPATAGGATADTPPSAASRAYVVMDAATGQVLVSKNAGQLEYPASVTKIMTLALALEILGEDADGNAQITVSQAAVDALIPRASMIALMPGEVVSLSDLLYAIKIESANDAANVLAEYVCGSMDAFCLAMTQKAVDLGLDGTQFTNPSGQPENSHYTTAYDMAQITRWAMSVPGFCELFGATSYTMQPTNLQPGGRRFNNSNLAMMSYSAYYCAGVTGSKTGYTDQARYTLVTTARRGDTELICVVLDCPYDQSKYNDTNALMDYCFDNFRRVEYTPSGIVDCKVPVYGGGGDRLGEIDVFADQSVSFLLHNSLSEDVVQVQAQVPEGYIIGGHFAPQVSLSLPDGLAQQQGSSLATLPLSWRGLEELLAANTTARTAGNFDLAQMAEEQPALFWSVIITVAAIVLLVAGIIVFRRVRRSHKKPAGKVQTLPTVRPRPRRKPTSAGTRGGTVDFRRPTSEPALRAANDGNDYGGPRRSGRAR